MLQRVAVELKFTQNFLHRFIYVTLITQQSTRSGVILSNVDPQHDSNSSRHILLQNGRK